MHFRLRGDSIAKQVKFVDNSAQVKREVRKLIGKALTAIGIEWQRIATLEINAQPQFRDNAIIGQGAVDTGLMRASNEYRVNVSVAEVVVGNRLRYALYVTYGTYKMPQRPWFQNSILNYTKEYENITVRVFKAA